jgi:hypothetical protein
MAHRTAIDGSGQHFGVGGQRARVGGRYIGGRAGSNPKLGPEFFAFSLHAARPACQRKAGNLVQLLQGTAKTLPGNAIDDEHG